MGDFALSVINTIKGMSVKDWLLTMATAALCFLGWLVFDLQQEGHLIDLLKPNPYTKLTVRSVNECLLEIGHNDQWIYRGLILPELSIEGYEFMIGYYRSDLDNIKNENSSEIVNLFTRQCVRINESASAIRERFADDDLKL
jgi:hypothetical protein